MNRVKAENEARAACAGLGWSEADVESFVRWHLGEEARRARREELDAALVDVAYSGLREKYAHKDFSEREVPFSDFEREAQNYRQQRNRGET